MKSAILFFCIHFLTSLVMTIFEVYFIYNIFAKYMNIVTSPYSIGLILGVLLLIITYLIVLKGTSTLVSFLPSILGTITLIVVLIFYIWKTQYLDGSGYFFVCVFLAPYVALSAIWSLIDWILDKLKEEQSTTVNQTSGATE